MIVVCVLIILTQLEFAMIVVCVLIILTQLEFSMIVVCVLIYPHSTRVLYDSCLCIDYPH